MKNSLKTGVAVLGASSLQAFAAVPASVTTGITEAVTDAGTIGAAILGVVIAIVGFNWLRRAIK